MYCATSGFAFVLVVSTRTTTGRWGTRDRTDVPPTVRTELTANLPEDAGFTIISTEELVVATMRGLRADRDENESVTLLILESVILTLGRKLKIELAQSRTNVVTPNL